MGTCGIRAKMKKIPFIVSSCKFPYLNYRVYSYSTDFLGRQRNEICIACYLNTLSFSLQDQLSSRRKSVLFFLCPAHEPQMVPRHSQVTSTRAKTERRKGNLGVDKFFQHHCLMQVLPSLQFH